MEGCLWGCVAYCAEIAPANFIQVRSFEFRSLRIWPVVCIIMLDLTIRTASRMHSQIKYVKHMASCVYRQNTIF